MVAAPSIKPHKTLLVLYTKVRRHDSNPIHRTTTRSVSSKFLKSGLQGNIGEERGGWRRW